MKGFGRAQRFDALIAAAGAAVGVVIVVSVWAFGPQRAEPLLTDACLDRGAASAWMVDALAAPTRTWILTDTAICESAATHATCPCPDTTVLPRFLRTLERAAAKRGEYVRPFGDAAAYFSGAMEHNLFIYALHEAADGRTSLLVVEPADCPAAAKTIADCAPFAMRSWSLDGTCSAPQWPLQAEGPLRERVPFVLPKLGSGEFGAFLRAGAPFVVRVAVAARQKFLALALSELKFAKHTTTPVEGCALVEGCVDRLEPGSSYGGILQQEAAAAGERRCERGLPFAVRARLVAAELVAGR
jgi:hypothetical protein